MPETDLLWMSLIVFLPSVFALVLLFIPKGYEEAMRWWALFGTALTLGVSLCAFVLFKAQVVDRNSGADKGAVQRQTLLERASPGFDAVPGTKVAHPREDDWIGRRPWIRKFNIDYYMGVDGISMPLVLLTTVLCVLAMIASWNIEKFVKGYLVLFLVLETGMLGTFLALDFFLFYIFWEVMLLPMYFLIGVWGGPRREYAAIKFFLYTLLGSVFILIALLAFYFTDVRDFVGPDRVVAALVPNGGKADDHAAYAAAASKAADLEEDVVKKRAAAAETQALLAAAQKDLAAETDPAKKAKLQEEVTKRKQAAADARKAWVPAEVARDKFVIERDTAFAKLANDPNGAVHTFDLVLLQRVGRAAMQHINGSPVEAASVTRARAEVERLSAVAEAAKGTPSASQAANNATAAQAASASAETGLAARLGSEKFFQPWFQITMFVFLFIGFAIKVPVFPFHTWLPDAHVEAPTPISMILAGVLLKLGGYGIIRLCYPICPYAAWYLAWGVALLGIINIVYGAFAAMAQTDFKKLVAYSSVSHMGYVLLGIAVWPLASKDSQFWSWGMNGAMFQMIAHGITSAGMFFCVGVIYDRAHHRNLDNFRGLNEPMPLYGGISAVVFFAAMGLPGMCGFVGEFMVILGTWSYSPPLAVLSALTVVITAAYILWTLQRVYLGTNPAYKNFPDITPRELSAIVPLVILSVVLGVAPALLLNWMEPSVTALIDSLASLKP